MKCEIEEFIDYLHNTRGTSKNTEVSYERDLRKLETYLTEGGFETEEQITSTVLNSYVLYMERKNFAASSISRSIASIRAFFQYLTRKYGWKENPAEKLKAPKKYGWKENPAEKLKAPKIEKKLPGILTVEEVDLLLAQPKGNTAKGIRDKAMLELLYATGIRVSELISLKIKDVNLKLGYLTCSGGDRERVIPFGSAAKQAVEKYMEGARGQLLGDQDSDFLFLNCSGKSMSRQGFWKVLKGYATSAGIQQDITPHTLRHSFAAHLLQNGADLKSVQEMMGHSDISSTQVYMNMNIHKIRDVYMKAHPRK